MEIKETNLADKQMFDFLDYVYSHNGYNLHDKYFKFRNSVLCLLDTVVNMVNVVEEENKSEFLDIVDVMSVLKAIHSDCLCIIDDVLDGMRRDILRVLYKPDETSNARLKYITPKLLHETVTKVSGNVIYKTPDGSVYLSLCKSLIHIIDNDMPEQDYSNIVINETDCESDEKSEKVPTSNNANKSNDGVKRDCFEYKILQKKFVSKDGILWHFDIFNINHKHEFVLANASNIKILAPANNKGYIRALEYIIKNGYTLEQ